MYLTVNLSVYMYYLQVMDHECHSVIVFCRGMDSLNTELGSITGELWLYMHVHNFHNNKFGGQVINEIINIAINFIAVLTLSIVYNLLNIPSNFEDWIILYQHGPSLPT